MTTLDTSAELVREIRDLGERVDVDHDDPELFVAWFLAANIVENERKAFECLTGHSGDKNVDAIFIDRSLDSVVLIQGKLHQKFGKGTEGRNDVIGFVESAAEIAGEDEQFKEFVQNLDAVAAKIARAARRSIRNEGYGLVLYYVTTGRCASKLRIEAERKARRISLAGEKRATLAMVEAPGVRASLDRYLRGVAPAVGSVELPLESEPFSFRDSKLKITSWTGAVSGRDLGKIVNQKGPRIFQLNIRGLLGETPINKEIRKTISREPHAFWYMNNGVTIICDEAHADKDGLGRWVLRMTEPQIINGQQTSDALSQSDQRQSKDSRVLVRVMEIRDGSMSEKEHAVFVDNVVRATNTQNRITSADLKSNDPIQILLAKRLLKRNYLYMRKRQGRRKAMADTGLQNLRVVTKEQLAQAYSACHFDSLSLRVGRKIWESKRERDGGHYEDIFPTADADTYLNCYWLMDRVEDAVHGRGAVAQKGRFFVARLVWEDLGGDITAHSDWFIRGSQARKKRPIFEKPLTDAIAVAVRQLDVFYRAKAGRGADRIPPANLFRREIYTDFKRHCRSAKNADKTRSSKALVDFKKKVRVQKFV